MDEIIRFGDVVCKCGQYMTFETSNMYLECIGCNVAINVSLYPVKEMIESVEDSAEEGE